LNIQNGHYILQWKILVGNESFPHYDCALLNITNNDSRKGFSVPTFDNYSLLMINSQFGNFSAPIHVAGESKKTKCDKKSQNPISTTSESSKKKIPRRLKEISGRTHVKYSIKWTSNINFIMEIEVVNPSYEISSSHLRLELGNDPNLVVYDVPGLKYQTNGIITNIYLQNILLSNKSFSILGGKVADNNKMQLLNPTFHFEKESSVLKTCAINYQIIVKKRGFFQHKLRYDLYNENNLCSNTTLEGIQIFFDFHSGEYVDYSLHKGDAQVLQIGNHVQYTKMNLNSCSNEITLQGHYKMLVKLPDNFRALRIGKDVFPKPCDVYFESNK
jgi:hypothetical protein